ncbi:MAG TPA: hypothetical protein VLF89_02495 [Candidatus Saccharimonadales bacterium]|nr:hypothetical protein [Candidatus Saccharimonadales bacterium]
MTESEQSQEKQFLKHHAASLSSEALKYFNYFDQKKQLYTKKALQDRLQVFAGTRFYTAIVNRLEEVFQQNLALDGEQFNELIYDLVSTENSPVYEAQGDIRGAAANTLYKQFTNGLYQPHFGNIVGQTSILDEDEMLVTITRSEDIVTGKTHELYGEITQYELYKAGARVGGIPIITVNDQLSHNSFSFINATDYSFKQLSQQDPSSSLAEISSDVSAKLEVGSFRVNLYIGENFSPPKVLHQPTIGE